MMMSLERLLALNEDTVFGQLGETAIYTPAGGGPVAIRVMPVPPPEVLTFGDTQLRADTDSFEVRVSEVASPAVGDALVYAGRSLVIKGVRCADARHRVWTIETRSA